MQWCWPPTRQQAGTAAGAASASGANKAASKTTNSDMEMPRLTGMRILAQDFSWHLSVVTTCNKLF